MVVFFIKRRVRDSGFQISTNAGDFVVPTFDQRAFSTPGHQGLTFLTIIFPREFDAIQNPLQNITELVCNTESLNNGKDCDCSDPENYKFSNEGRF